MADTHSTRRSIKLGLVVTTAHAGEALMQPLRDLLLQQGDFELRLHVQCWGEGEQAGRQLQSLALQLCGRDVAVACRAVDFSYAVNGDATVDRAAARVWPALLADEEAVTAAAWLPLPDRMVPGALGALAEFLQLRPDIHWLSAVYAEDGRERVAPPLAVSEAVDPDSLQTAGGARLIAALHPATTWFTPTLMRAAGFPDPMAGGSGWTQLFSRAARQGFALHRLPVPLAGRGPEALRGDRTRSQPG